MLVLDTHAWVWFVSGSSKLRPDTITRMLDLIDDGRFLIPAMAVWEVAFLTEHGRLELSDALETWIDRALDPMQFQLAPLTPEIAVAAARIPDRRLLDPADRLIVATALVTGFPLATRDRQIVDLSERTQLSLLPV